jgi:pyruvate formate lyase activating enzyme
VLDTLQWLVHESQTWVEITNLIIPQANDSPEVLERMCRWIATELRPDVPLHFSAFHPDFKLTDRGPTPPATLQTAYEVARGAGLRYVYTGNVYDPQRQHTYCPACGRVVIRREGYEVSGFELRGGRCAHCQTPIAGRFDDSAGSWGGRRMPIKIAN